MVRWMVLLASVGLIGCGYSEETYLQEEAEAACAFTVDCYPGLYDSEDDCIALRGEVVPTAGCEYDAQAAGDCVDGLQELACPEEGAAPAFPPACDNVYGACGGDE